MTEKTTQAMKKPQKHTFVRDLLILTLAMFIGGSGWALFLLPNHIPLGGLAGFSSILWWGFKIPVSASFIGTNIILLGFALRILGWRFCLKTIYSATVFSLFADTIQAWYANSTLLNDQPFMAAILGGGCLGVSVGLCLSYQGSTGGTDVIAAMVNKYHDISLGKVIMLVDIMVVSSCYVVLQDWEQVLYGYVVLFVSSICVDKVVNMMRQSVQFFIISEKYEEIGRAINEKVLRGCTTISGNGFYSGRDVKMLFVLARQNESRKIFQTIESIDPNAFVSQSAVIGVYGLGFDKFKAKRTKSVKNKKKLTEDTSNSQQAAIHQA